MATPSTASQRTTRSRHHVTHTAHGKILDAVLTFGAQSLRQKDVTDHAGVKQSNFTPLKKPTNDGFGPLLTANPVRFTAEMGLVIAISVGAERIRAGLLDANGVLHCKKISAPQRHQLDLPQRDLLQLVGRLVADVLEEALDDPDLQRPGHKATPARLPVFAAAMALPTPIARDHRQVNHALNHSSWGQRRPFPTLNHALANALGPLFDDSTAQVMNDCNAASIALAFDHVRKHDPPRTNLDDDTFRERSTIMVVRVGGGVGCGIIEIAADRKHVTYVSRFLKSHVLVGTNALAGEIGHMPISESPVKLINQRGKAIPGLHGIDYAKSRCACGQFHHLQALIGAAAFAKRIGLDTDASDMPLLVQLGGHLGPGASQAATQALRDAGELLGKALVGPVLAIDIKGISVIGTFSEKPLIKGLQSATVEWDRAFHRGAEVEMLHPGPEKEWIIPRGAGLALMREHRHRRLREIGRGQLRDLMPPLDLDLNYMHRLREGNWRR